MFIVYIFLPEVRNLLYRKRALQTKRRTGYVPCASCFALCLFLLPDAYICAHTSQQAFGLVNKGDGHLINHVAAEGSCQRRDADDFTLEFIIRGADTDERG